MALYDVASLWVGPSLTWLEQLCLKSFVDNGHRTILFSYEPVAGVPEGVEQRDANEIYPADTILRHERTGSPAFHSDIFRLLMLKNTDLLWVDTDAYCVQPWHRPDHGYFFGWGHDRQRKPYTGVLGLPHDSQTLHSMLEMSEDPYPIPPWLRPKLRKELAEQKEAGEPVHATQLRWGLFGPDALNHFAHQNGEIDYAAEPHVFYPISFEGTRVFTRADSAAKIKRSIKPDTLSIHFYGRRFRNLFARMGGMPVEGSYVDGLCREHGIDPSQTAHLFVGDKRVQDKEDEAEEAEG